MSEKDYTPVLTAELDSLYLKFAEMESTIASQAATIAQLQQEREVLLDHLDAARAAITNAQQWADQWKDHAFAAQAERDAMRALLMKHRRYFNDPRNGRLEFVSEIDKHIGPEAALASATRSEP